MKKMHVNSLLTYYQEIEKFNRREAMVYGWLIQRQGQAFTAREIKESLFGTAGDMNLVRPRLTTLKTAGWVIERKKAVKCSVTGKPVATFEALTAEQKFNRENTGELFQLVG